MKIRDYITTHRLKCIEFAEMAEISQPALSLYMSGDRTPSPSVAKRIIAATNGAVTWDDLYADPVETQREAA